MPTIFSFQQGNESRARQNEESPLLGRFRAVPADEGRERRRSSAKPWFASLRRTYHSYGALNDSGSDEREDELQEAGRFDGLRSLLLAPEHDTIKHAVERWWGRWLLLFALPALIVCS